MFISKNKIIMINKEKAFEEFKVMDIWEKKKILLNIFEKMLIYKPEIKSLIDVIEKVSEIENNTTYDFILDNSYKIVLDSIEKVDKINEKESIEIFEKSKSFLKEMKLNEENEEKINESELEEMLNNI